jgi:short subunit dehydrogenase-like uncharacterized protein
MQNGPNPEASHSASSNGSSPVPWMLYGATGYTGPLIIEEAIARGHRPVLAGRSREKLAELAGRYGLDYVAFSLDNAQSVAAELRRSGVRLVLHVAGPFIHTSLPMLQACIESGVHYLDITGEIAVYEQTFAHDSAARAAGIVAMSGVGFDIVPSDCLSRYVADRHPGATRLEVAIHMSGGANASGSGISAGTAKSGLEMLAQGLVVRRGGELVRYDLGRGSKPFRFPNRSGDGIRTYTGVVIPWGDVSTAYRTTGIPNITCYGMTTSDNARFLEYSGYLLRMLLRFPEIRRWATTIIDETLSGPSEQARQENRTWVYARASGDGGGFTEAWLEMPEAYHFTALSSVRIVEKVLHGDYTGARTPTGAFGADFVREIPGTRRYDHLNETITAVE